MEHYYIIHSFINNDYISSTDILKTKNDAKNLKDILDKDKDKDNTKDKIENIIYYCKPLNENNENNIKLKDMKLYRYLNGFLLVPDKNSIIYGLEILHDGYWMKDMEGWFYDKKLYDKISCYQLEPKKLKIDYSKYNFNFLESYFYKNGFILKPNINFKYYGQKNLIGGKWIEKEKGWYFKNIKKYNIFLKLGMNDDINGTYME